MKLSLRPSLLAPVDLALEEDSETLKLFDFDLDVVLGRFSFALGEDLDEVLLLGDEVVGSSGREGKSESASRVFDGARSTSRAGRVELAREPRIEQVDPRSPVAEREGAGGAWHGEDLGAIVRHRAALMSERVSSAP